MLLVHDNMTVLSYSCYHYLVELLDARASYHFVVVAVCEKGTPVISQEDKAEERPMQNKP